MLVVMIVPGYCLYITFYRLCQYIDTSSSLFKSTLRLSLVLRKPVRHKPGCTATEDGYRIEISDLDRSGIALSM